MTKRELRQLQAEIDSLVQFDCFTVINMMLTKLCYKLRELEQDKILAYLRICAAHSAKLSVWNPFVMSVFDELTRRNLEAHAILKDYLKLSLVTKVIDIDGGDIPPPSNI